jgi:hypothetical protein
MPGCDESSSVTTTGCPQPDALEAIPLLVERIWYRSLQRRSQRGKGRWARSVDSLNASHFPRPQFVTPGPQVNDSLPALPRWEPPVREIRSPGSVRGRGESLVPTGTAGMGSWNCCSYGIEAACPLLSSAGVGRRHRRPNRGIGRLRARQILLPACVRLASAGARR